MTMRVMNSLIIKVLYVKIVVSVEILEIVG